MCGITGILNEEGKLIPGNLIVASISSMSFRYNGLGGGFAGYGIYPEYKEYYALHMIFNTEETRSKVNELLNRRFDIIKDEPIPTRNVEAIKEAHLAIRGFEQLPITWRYFVKVPERYGMNADDYVVETVMKINSSIPGACVYSSGKNMGVFKAVGYPADVGKYFKIGEYEAYIWLGHGRYPTNTPGWWAGAHPFNILDWSVVHNGEISSYGTNKRLLEMWGYNCTFLTDTEVMAYLFDLLVRKHRLPLEIACTAMASPFWSEIDKADSKTKQLLKTIRMIYGAALVNGPFSVLVGKNDAMIGFTDRIKLRPLIVAKKNNQVYMASEECGIREICGNPDRIWAPKAGSAAIARVRWA